MKNILRTAAALALFALTACVYEEPDEAEAASDISLLNFSLSLPMSRAGNAATDQYAPGEGYENYIDIKNKGYRIYFFDNTNKYIASFIPMLITASDSSENTYDVLGKATDDITGLSDFKVVVLANWPSYPDALQRGVSTIDDLCSDATAQFNCLSSFELDPDKGLTIPFFGVRHYTGITIEKGKLTTFTEPVTLLRAMAKIEVVVDIDGVSPSRIGLRGYNKKGYCAPDKVYTQGDYDHNGNWDSDYVKTPHLIGGANDADQGSSFLPMFCRQRRDGTKKETWIAYVPEYRNTDSADGTVNYKSRIELTLDAQKDGTAPSEIFFADYDTNGNMIANTYTDILRNNCYRFTVKMRGGAFLVNVKQWENAFDNNFEY